MGIGKSFKKFLKDPLRPLTAIGLGGLDKILHPFLNPPIPKPKVPKSLEQSSSTYNAEARINSSRLGDTKAVVYGQCWVWPAYCSMPYKYFEGHDQILAAYLHISVGQAAVPRIRIGDTDATRFPGFLSELCLPGVDMELILPNVYTCPEVEGIELLGGALDKSDTDGITTVKFIETGTTTIDAAAGTWSSDTEGAFDDFQVNDEIGVFAAGANNGSYTITRIEDDGRTIFTDPPPASTTTQSEIGFFVQRRWAGPFPACSPGATVHTIAFDIVFNALRNEGDPDGERTVEVVVQCRQINDAGVALDPDWDNSEEATYTFTDNVNRARRYTFEFITEDEARYEARLWRKTYEQNDSEDPSSAAQWVGLKGYIVDKPGDTPASDDDSTRLAIIIRSSGFLASQSQSAVNCLVQRELPIYDSGGWTDPVFTRNPAWAAVDWMVNQSQGAIDLADLDVPSFVASAAEAVANEDTFDAVFDREVGLWEGAQSILRVARSAPILDPFTRLYKVYRDEPTDPVQLFGDGFNCRAGGDSISLPDADTVSGVYVTFMDPLLWTEREGPIVGTDVDPRRSQGFGFTTWDAAWREANLQYRDLLYRNHSVSLQTEMEGLLPVHGDRVLLASAAKGWGYSGEVVEQSGTTLRVWPAPVWTAGRNHFVYLQDDDGVPQGPFPCSHGSGPDVLELDSDPGLTLRVGAGWRSLFAFGHDGEGVEADAPRIAIVQERSTDGLRTATLQLLFDNDFVHEDPGPAPEDPYATDSEIPDLTITGLIADSTFTGAILDEEGNAILDEDENALVDEAGGLGVVIHVEWDAVAGATSYQLRWKYVGVPGWNIGYIGIDNQADFAVTADGEVRIRVKAISTTYIGPETETSILITEFP